MSVCPTRCPATRENDKHIGSEDSLPSGVLLPFCGTSSKRSMFSILYPVLRRVSTCDTLNTRKKSTVHLSRPETSGTGFQPRRAGGLRHERRFQLYPISRDIRPKEAQFPIPGDPAQGHGVPPSAKIFQRGVKPLRIIPLGKLYEIISSQSRRPMSEDVFAPSRRSPNMSARTTASSGTLTFTQTAGRRI